MALHPRDVDPRPYLDPAPRARARLRLVTPPPRRGRAGAALLFVVLLAGILGAPVIDAASGTDPAPLIPNPGRSARLPTALDPIDPLSARSMPRSREPVAGFAFVRCTRLWISGPDGSDARRIADMPGISYPTFSPDARSIAFVHAGEGGDELWMAAADGSEMQRLGEVTSDGGSVPARVKALTWSPKRDVIGFALASESGDPWRGASSVWTLDLATGRFESAGVGAPLPFWWDRDSIAFVPAASGADEDLASPSVEDRPFDRISSGDDEVTATIAPRGWTRMYRRGVVVVTRSKGEMHATLMNHLYSNRGRELVPPAGYSISDRSRPQISQDRALAMIEIVDARNQPAIGLVDLDAGKWTVLDYSWNPAASPAPASTGPLRSRQAVHTARGLLYGWNESPGQVAMLVGNRERELVPFDNSQVVTNETRREDGGWRVDATVLGELRNNGFGARDLSVALRERDGRVTADVSAASPLRRVETIADALDVIRAGGVEVLDPTWLPEGTTLKNDVNYDPLYVWRWRGVTTAQLHLEIPRSSGGGMVTLTYGGASFSMGCGSINEPVATTVAGVAAVRDHVGGAHQIVWPATFTKPEELYSLRGDYSVYTTASAEVATRIAEGMQAPGS